MPCFNEEACIERAINSVLSQTYKNIKLFVSDNDSTDKTVEIIKKYPQVFLLRQPRNIGVAASGNSLYGAVKKHNASYYCGLAADEVMYTDCIEKRVRYLEENPDKSTVFTGLDFQLPDRKIIWPETLSQYKRLFTAKWDNLYSELLEGNFIPCTALHNLGKIDIDDLRCDEKLKRLPDLDVFLKWSKKYRVGFLSEATQCSDWDGKTNSSAPSKTAMYNDCKEMIYILSKQLFIDQRDEDRIKTIAIINNLSHRMYYEHERITNASSTQPAPSGKETVLP